MDKESTCLFMSCDMNFIHHLRVAIKSIKYNSKNTSILFLCVRDKGAEKYFKKHLSDLISENFQLKIIICNKIKLDKIFKNHQTTHPIECYFRILIGSILPKEINKVIYLDTDIIVNRDLDELFNHNLKKTIGGVVDFIGEKEYKKRILKDFGINIKNYINAGILLINIKKWRELNYEKKMIIFLEENLKKLDMLDMDIINIFFKEEIKILESGWNGMIFSGKLIPEKRKIPSIYHMIWHIKGDSLLYPNYYVKKLYSFYENKSKASFYNEVFQIIFHALIAGPLGSFYHGLYSLKYKYKLNDFLIYLEIFLVLYPPIGILFIKMIIEKILRKIINNK